MLYNRDYKQNIFNVVFLFHSCMGALLTLCITYPFNQPYNFDKFFFKRCNKWKHTKTCMRKVTLFSGMQTITVNLSLFPHILSQADSRYHNFFLRYREHEMLVPPLLNGSKDEFNPSLMVGARLKELTFCHKLKFV